MDHQMNVAGFNARKFIGSAIEGIELGPYQEVVQELSKAVDDIERETGAALDSGNEKGWDSLKKKVEVGGLSMFPDTGYTALACVGELQ